MLQLTSEPALILPEAALSSSSSTSAQSLPGLIAPPRVDETSSSAVPQLKKAQEAKLKKVVNKAEKEPKPAAKASGRAPRLNRVLPVFPRQETDKLSYAAKVLEQGRLRARFRRKDDVWKGKEREHVPLDIGGAYSTAVLAASHC